jgi:hypothetical protein
MTKEQDSTAAGRGYDRILTYIELTILGAGEGYFNRFKSMHKGELHSVIGTLFFSYGIIGLGLFLLMFLKFKYKKLFLIKFLTPMFLYSLTHNGIRNPLFWIIIAITFCYAEKKRYVNDN